nr:PREDICTED: uncharacterized protein LOC109030042 [Bemisia tabaci]
MCLILHSWFGKDLGDGVMLGSVLGILLTFFKSGFFGLLYYLTVDKHTFWDRELASPSPLTYFIYDLVILLAFILIFIGGKKCSSALLVTGLICLIVGFVAQFLSLTVHIAAWIAKGQQLQHGAANAHPTFFIKRTTEMPFLFSEEPTMRTTLTVTALFILTAMYLIYTFYFIMTVTSYTAHIGEVRVR